MPKTPLEISNWIRPDDDTWIIRFNYATNPIPMNGSRGHYRIHARKVRDVRDRAYYMARFARIPAMEHCRAQLTWWVPDRRVRDEDNLAGLEKPIFDALKLAGVVPDDRPEFMEKPRGRIRHLSEADGMVSAPCFTLTVERLDRREQFA